MSDKALDALLAEHEKHLTVLPDGRVQCELNGHTMPPRLDVVRAFVNGAKYQRLARAAEADASLEQYAPFIVPSANFPQMLYCALTGQLIERSMDAVRRHLRGKRWAGAKARFASDKQALRPEPSLAEFGVRLPGEEGKEGTGRRKKGAGGSGSGGEEDEDDDEPMFRGSSGSESGSEEEDEDESGSGSGSGSEEEEGEHEEMEEDSEEEEAPAPPPKKAARPAGKAARAAAAPEQQQQQKKKKVVVAKRRAAAAAAGGAKQQAAAAPPPPPPPAPAAPKAAAAKGPGGKKRNPTRPSKAKKARA